MLGFSVFLTLFACLFYTILLYLVFAARIEKSLKIYFLFYLLSMMFAQAALFLVTVSKDPLKVAVFYRIHTTASLAYFGFFYPLVREFTGRKAGITVVVLSLIVTTASMVIAAFGTGLNALVMGEAGFLIPELELSALLLFIPVYGFWMLGLATLIIRYAKAPSLFLKNKYKYLIIGAFLVVVGGFSNLTFLQHFPVDVFCYLLNALLLGYAILRHRVLDITAALKKGSLIAALFA